MTPYARSTIWLFGATLLLIGIPVRAQDFATPTPQSTTTTVVRELADAAERLSILGFVAAVIALTALGIVLFIVLGVYKVGLKPFVDTAAQERQERTNIQTRLDAKNLRDDEREKELAALRGRTAEIQERTIKALIDLETRKEAADSRGAAVSTINAHTDQAHKDTVEAVKKLLDDALQGVQVVQQKQEQREASSHETADLTLPNVERNLIEAKQKVEKLHDTGPLSPAAVPADPASGTAAA